MIRIIAPGLTELQEAEARIKAEEQDLGLEYVGAGHGMNRAQRRAKVRVLKRLTRRPESVRTLYHPLTKKITPYGIKVIAARRAKNRLQKESRKRNR